MPSHVYLLASPPYGTLYLGREAQSRRRIVAYRHKTYPGRSATHGIDRLVWMEDYATAREKMIKNWRRVEIELIEAMNPLWVDLFDQLDHEPPSFQGSAQPRSRNRVLQCRPFARLRKTAR